jgi:hypothetical protein
LKLRVIASGICLAGVGFWLVARALRAIPSDPSPCEAERLLAWQRYLDRHPVETPISHLIDESIRSGRPL